MKKLISILAALCLVFTFALTACNSDGLETLDTPENVTVSDTGLISWDAVENAEYYVVVLDGEPHPTDETSYQVSSVVNDFTYSVYARAQGYNDSAPSETKTFTGKGGGSVDLPAKITVGIDGSSEVRSGKTLQLSAVVSGTDNTDVVWSVDVGGEYAEISESGLLTAKDVSGNKIVTVRATSAEDATVYGEKVITITAKPALTQAMLDELMVDTVSFDGFININVYTISGLFESKLVDSYVITGFQTAMDGESWYAQYVDNSTGITNSLFYKNVDDLACQVNVSLMNEERYYPMTDDDGSQISWEDAGLYNNFIGLKVEDFTFDTESWRWMYSGDDQSLINRMVASADPYEFDAVNFGLVVEEGAIFGIYAVSNDNYQLVNGYKAIQELTVMIDFNEYVEVPKIGKFVYDDEVHGELKTAIDNMHALDSYTLSFSKVEGSIYASSYTLDGFKETITSEFCYFEPYTYLYNSDYTENRTYTGDNYGYRKINDGLYNSFSLGDNGEFYATRAYESDFSNAKPSFAFAPEIFTGYYRDTDGSTTFYVNELMTVVASTFYYGVGNEVQLYGLFAAENTFTPYVTVKDGYIVEAGFYYDMGYLYGIVEMTFGDFDSAALPDDFTADFETRTVPVSWSELTIITSDDSSSTSEDLVVNALEYFQGYFEDEDIEEKLPFFGAVLGDTYGFGLTLYRSLDSETAANGTNRSRSCVVFYYDVPLDEDWTIDTTLKAVDAYLLELGFEKNSYGEYWKDDIVILPLDNSLDFMIYMWHIA